MKDEIIIKISEEDILRILVTYFQETEVGESWGFGKLLGTPNKDLHFISVYRKDLENLPVEYDLEELDMHTTYRDPSK